MATTQENHCNAKSEVLLMAMELSASKWKLAFGRAGQRKVCRPEVDAGVLDALNDEMAKAKSRLGLPPDAKVVSCYEAGRDGFWIHRYLADQGVENLVVDSSSIEVDRRQRRATTDRLDVQKLFSMLQRCHAGESDVWSVLQVPTIEQEDARHLS